VRDEFENRLRSAVIAVATTLLQEGDLQRAEELLRRAYAALRDDEEILMLLCDALNRLDKRIEAERLRLQASIG
jgi:Flp pilus assembly protein TadD